MEIHSGEALVEMEIVIIPLFTILTVRFRTKLMW
jgi:hypothetical protein